MIDMKTLTRFVATSSPGDSLCLGRGEALPADVGAQINLLAAGGVLHPARTRISARDFAFVAQRGSAPISRIHSLSGGPAAPRPRKDRRAVSPVPSAARRSTETMLLRVIRWCVAQQRPCPTNDDLARACGLSGGLAVSYRLRKLVAENKIAIDHFGPFEHRVITLLIGRRAGQSTPRHVLASAPATARRQFSQEHGA